MLYSRNRVLSYRISLISTRVKVFAVACCFVLSLRATNANDLFMLSAVCGMAEANSSTVTKIFLQCCVRTNFATFEKFGCGTHTTFEGKICFPMDSCKVG